MIRIFFLSIFIATLSLGCGSKSARDHFKRMDVARTDTMMIANLDLEGKKLDQISTAFSKNNPGYALDYSPATFEVQKAPTQRIIFVQKGGGTASLNDLEYSKISVGDIILLDPETRLTIDSLVDLLVFTTPEVPADSIPHFIRPDWDLHITDTPGGCATETNAYRRILLTWQGSVGKYLYKSLNAHRVRITDSFTHYHPLEGGFDEFYLVQMVQPGAAIISCNRFDLIENHEQLSDSLTKPIMHKTELKVGDLVYLPRGVVHRGIGGVLAQVITVPGFIPGAEIGVDHHLKKMNERFKLTQEDTFPYHAQAANTVMIK